MLPVWLIEVSRSRGEKRTVEGKVEVSRTVMIT
jgi:hypothetical protein